MEQSITALITGKAKAENKPNWDALDIKDVEIVDIRRSYDFLSDTYTVLEIYA